MSGPPLHVHTREDELFYVLEGEVVFQIADQRILAKTITEPGADLKVCWMATVRAESERHGVVGERLA